MDVKRIKGWGALLQAAYQGYKKNTFILIPALVPVILSIFVQAISLSGVADSSQGFLASAIIFILMAAVVFLAGIYISAGMLGIVRSSIKNKSGKSSMAAFWKAAKTKFLSLLGAYIIAYAIIFSIILAAMISLIFNPLGSTVELFIVLIYLVLVVFTVLLVSFASYAVVLADLKAVPALRESSEFVKRNFFSVIILLLITIVLIAAAIFLATAVAALAANEMVVNFTVNLVVWLITPYILFLFSYFYASKTKRKI